MIDFNNFLFLAITLVIVPGPDYVIITKNTLTKGTLAGFQTLSGTAAALACHTIFAVVGLSALVMKSALLFTLLKYLGAAYLLYLGVKALVSKQSSDAQEQDAKQTNPFLQGFLTNLLNPKVAIFFLTFLPQFISVDNTSWVPFAVLGAIYIALTVAFFGLYVTFLKKIRSFMEKQRTQALINKFSGLILVVFGIKLIIEQ